MRTICESQLAINLKSDSQFSVSIKKLRINLNKDLQFYRKIANHFLILISSLVVVCTYTSRFFNALALTCASLAICIS